MTEINSETNPEYVHDDAATSSKLSFVKTRGFRISAITIGAALALAGSFGAGVLAGEKLGGRQDDQAFGNHQFGGGFGNGNKFGPGQGFDPRNDPDHGAGTDRPGGPDDGFKLPNPATTAPTGTKS